MAKLSQPKNFDELLLEAIDEGLSGLGEAGKTSIYIHLEGLFNIRKQEIPNKLDGFSNALQRIFGLGARQLEDIVHEKSSCKSREPMKLDGPSWLAQDMTFTKYVSHEALLKDTETKKSEK